MNSWKFIYNMVNMHVKHHKSMLCNGRKYCTKQLYDENKTCDNKITTIFYVTNVSHKPETHPITSNLWYYGYLEDILDIEFKCFKVVLLKARW